MHAETAQLLEDLRDYIAKNLLLLTEGREAELGALQEIANELNQRTLRLPPQERLACMEEMEKIIADLNALEDALRMRRDEIGTKVGQSEQHRRANLAYRTAPPSKPDKEEK